MASFRLSKRTEEQRSALFYNRYEYRVSFKIIGVNKTYYETDSTKFENRINGQKYDYMRSGQIDALNYLSLINFEEIAEFMAFRNRHYNRNRKTNDALFVLSGDIAKVYFNDPHIETELALLNFNDTELTKAVVSLPAEVKFFHKEPKNKFRVYFKAKTVDDAFKTSLSDFISQYEEIVPSDALNLWLKGMGGSIWRKRYLLSSHYLDFDSDGMYMLLLLMFGSKYLGKHYELRKRDF